MRTVLLLAALVWPAAAQLPDFYKSVDRVIWVVKDLDAVTAGWDKAGFGPMEKIEADTFRIAMAKLPNVEIDWIQPQAKDAMSDFLARRGEGVFSLVHRVPTLEALNREVERLGALGVKVLQRGNVGEFTYVFFDTEREGKYVLGLIAGPEFGPPPGSALPVTQYAFVARDTRAVSAFWEKLGWPPMTYTHGGLRDLEYRGKPGQFDQELGWHRHGKVAYEWIKPLKGPTVYEDHLKVHGEGFHHFGIDVPDMDKAIAGWKQRGFTVSQAGGWGEAGKPGSGRFAYIDTDAMGAITIELLWNYR